MRLRPLPVMFALSVLTACAPSWHSAPLSVSEAIPPMPSHCHVPSGGKPGELAERGIGGTGGTTPPPSGSMLPSLGVAGIIDGFGSVCLVGLEVGLLPGTTVAADGTPAGVGDLRVGQQAVLAAAWAGGRPVTDHLLIRHVVIGPIDRTDGDGQLIVAGQTVRLAPAAWVDAPLRPGRWVAVSGLRTPSGDIVATRIDTAAGPDVLLHGRLDGTAVRPLIGRLPVTLSGGSVPIGSNVVLRGVETGGTLEVTNLTPDLLTDDPAALFGGQVHHFLIQTLTGSGGHAASFNPGMGPPPGAMGPPGTALAPGAMGPPGTALAPGAMGPPGTAFGGWSGPPNPGNPSSSPPHSDSKHGSGAPGAQRR